MQPQRLLAKSHPAESSGELSAIPGSIFLPNHLAEVAASNQAIISVTGARMLEAVGLKSSLRHLTEIVINRFNECYNSSSMSSLNNR